MTVTGVIPIDKRKCKVFLEEDFAFVLYKGELKKLEISEGSDISREQYEAVLEEILLPRARERALYLLQAQGRTRAQLRRRLTEDGYPPEVTDRVLEFLEQYRFVDDSTYAESYVSSNRLKKSRRQMEYELRQKGVDPETLSRVMEEAAPEDEASARRLVEKRLKGRRELSYEEKGKLGAYLGRKGYSYDVIWRVIGGMREE